MKNFIWLILILSILTLFIVIFYCILRSCDVRATTLLVFYTIMCGRRFNASCPAKIWFAPRCLSLHLIKKNSQRANKLSARIWHRICLERFPCKHGELKTPPQSSRIYPTYGLVEVHLPCLEAHPRFEIQTWSTNNITDHDDICWWYHIRQHISLLKIFTT